MCREIAIRLANILGDFEGDGKVSVSEVEELLQHIQKCQECALILMRIEKGGD